MRLAIGMKVARLMIIADAPRDNRGRRKWLCSCDCGTQKVMDSWKMQSGHVVSCGCKRLDVIRRHNAQKKENAKKMPHIRAATSWRHMMERYHDTQCHNFYRYGGRGIIVCERWHDFGAFLSDMGDPPRGHTIERKDNDGNYEPSNCEWATRRAQSRNRSTTKLCDDDVRRIYQRVLNGEDRRAVARENDISLSTVSAIMSGQNWADVTGVSARRAA